MPPLPQISVRYPIVELITGLLFFAIFLWRGPTLEAVKLCVFSAIQVTLVAMDLEERILADEFTKGGIVLGMLFAVSCRCPVAFWDYSCLRTGLIGRSPSSSRLSAPEF